MFQSLFEALEGHYDLKEGDNFHACGWCMLQDQSYLVLWVTLQIKHVFKLALKLFVGDTNHWLDESFPIFRTCI
jgi:hypothetical protein